ncbi:MAG TPA: hypothetical protein VFM25_15260 [Verrucomicrobiae bacterium]|nr:hypothetical protein [Verrucomicrobiae bacterium]
MKACDYCGRENDDAAAHCKECGLDFPIQEPLPSPPVLPTEELPTFDFINLDEIESAFDFKDGFSRPDWNLIRQKIKSATGLDNHREAWNEAVTQWLFRLKNELGGDYRVVKSRYIAWLGALDADATHRLSNFAEAALSSIRGSLADVARGKDDCFHVIMVFTEEDDYYQYISEFYPDGNHSKSAGIHVNVGYPHIALLYDSELRAGETIAHELTHHALNHLPIPLWLNEGVAVVLQKAIGGYSPPAYQGAASAYWGMVSGWTPPVVWPELAEKHHEFWNEDRIQHFWAGTSFHCPGESVELSYSLAEILIHLLNKNRENFLAFIRFARREDAGQNAALDCLDTCLGDAAATFLGEGNWRPQRKAIKACWQTNAATAEDS